MRITTTSSRSKKPSLVKVYRYLEGGQLYDRILKLSQFREKDASQIVQQILLALNYMQKRNIVHRDIKPENILLESSELGNMNIKVTDFGFAQFYDPEYFEGFDDILGSPLYMAPEIVKKLKYDKKIDIWSLGIVTYIMLSGRPPFNAKSKEEIFQQILTQTISLTEGVWSKVSKEARNFVKRCLTRDPKMRPCAEELLGHDWIKAKAPDDALKATGLDILNISGELENFRKTTTFQ